MPYCLYLRKSRADLESESHGEGETLARHETSLLATARRLHLDVTVIYREIVSGETISARPVMQQLISEVQSGLWAGVLVMEVERLARGDTIDQGIVSRAFLLSGTKIITPSKTYDPENEFDEEYFEFGLFMSRREYKTINRRLQRGRLASVNEGKYIGSIRPYGYIRKKLDKQKGYTLEPHEYEAKIVRMIFDWYTNGELQTDRSIKRLGVSLIAKKLNELVIAPMKGDKWVTSTIQDLLKNPVYIGKIRYNSRHCVKNIVDGKVSLSRPRADASEIIIADGLHPAIIDDDTWNLAQHNIVGNRSVPLPKGRSIQNPLAGLFFCGVCNRRMVRRSHSNVYPASLMCPLPRCKCVSSQLNLVEERAIAALSMWLESYKARWSAENDSLQNNNHLEIKRDAIKLLIQGLNTQKKQLDNLHDLLEQGVYSAETFLLRSKALNDRISESNEQIEKLSNEIRNEEENQYVRSDIIPQTQRVVEMYWLTESPALRNELLKDVVERIVYNKTESGRWSGNIDDFDLVLYPKLERGKTNV